MPSRKHVFLFLLFILTGSLTIAVGAIPEFISDELKPWFLEHFGPSYPWYFIGFFVVACFVLVALSGEFKDLFLKPKDSTPQTPEREQQTQEIRTYLRERYQNRLNQKLASRQPVNLRRLTSTEGTSERVAATFIPYSTQAIRGEIGKTFQEAHGRLLIVGQPGAGKTTLLLQLADRLFDLEADALPVVINLASWQCSYGKLETWLEAVLAAELSTNKAGAKAVLRQSGLILLLDGLDELKKDEAINSCLAAIADFGATPGRRFVITCRIEEYKRVPEDARVNLQIEVGPLTGGQLEAELTRMGREQPEAIPLLQAIQKDPLLRQAVETPFYFNTLQLLFAGRLPVFSAGDLEGRKAEIKEMFVAAALQNTELKEYPSERARHWLAFLASRMNERNLVVFELKNLQYEWWYHWLLNEKYTSRFCEGLVGGLTGNILIIAPLIGILKFIATGLYAGLLFGIKIGLFLAILIGVVNGFQKSNPTIDTIDLIEWSKKILWMMFAPLIPALLLGFTFGNLFFIITFALALGLTFGLFELIQMNRSSKFIQIKSPYQRFFASIKALHFSILQHFHLRYLLHKKGALPLDPVDFLNEMSARHLLETDGATWRFRHRIIQDYFAGQWVEPEGEKKN